MTVSERNNDSGGESTQTIVGTGGAPSPLHLDAKKKVVTKTANHSVVERRVQRYNPQGQPTRQALVREEEKKLPNGAIEKTTTVYEEDVNGSLQPTERTVSRETVSGEQDAHRRHHRAPRRLGRISDRRAARIDRNQTRRQSGRCRNRGQQAQRERAAHRVEARAQCDAEGGQHRYDRNRGL